ncbi:hypothetical protein YC2023_066860 [Brassica napus]
MKIFRRTLIPRNTLGNLRGNSEEPGFGVLKHRLFSPSESKAPCKRVKDRINWTCNPKSATKGTNVPEVALPEVVVPGRDDKDGLMLPVPDQYLPERLSISSKIRNGKQLHITSEEATSDRLNDLQAPKPVSLTRNACKRYNHE